MRLGDIVIRDLLIADSGDGLRPLLATIRSDIAEASRAPVLVAASPSTPISEAARIMAEYELAWLPIVEDGRLIGVVSEDDLHRVSVDPPPDDTDHPDRSDAR